MNNVAIIFGGVSNEHEVSILSAQFLIQALSKVYTVFPIYITKEGEWKVTEAEEYTFPSNEEQIREIFTSPLINKEEGGSTELYFHEYGIDTVFPIIHGGGGEDGRLSSFFRMIGFPVVGSTSSGLMASFDKEITKHILQSREIPVVPDVTLDSLQEVDFNTHKERLGTPLFIKPARSGSSVGVRKVSNKEGYNTGLQQAFEIDSKVLIEKDIQGRELEISVIEKNGDTFVSSVAGEICAPKEGFYSYDEKYSDSSATGLEIPANIDDELLRTLQNYAKRACEACECREMARVDFLLDVDDSIYLNEINTFPGFTGISMYPKLLRESGFSDEDIVKTLIASAR